jgi:hypothetical protein
VNEAQMERCNRVRDTAARFIQQVENGARYFDNLEAEDITESLLEAAQFVVDTTNKMIAENEGPTAA